MERPLWNVDLSRFFMGVTVRSSRAQVADRWQGSIAPLDLRYCSFSGLYRLDGDLGFL